MNTKLHLSPFSTNHVSRTFFHSALMTVVVLLLVLGGVKLLAPFSSSAKQDSQSGAGQQSNQCLKCPAPSQQIIYAPLIDLPEASSSEINLNCRSSHPMDVTPTFYKADGTPIVGEVIHLKPADILFVDTSSLIPAEYRQQGDWGGMSLSYTGQYREVWAQITLHGVNRGDSVNVLFSVLNDARSNSQGAVWWMPRNGEATIALGNGSGERIQATLEFSDGESRDVNLDPFATEIVTRHANQRGGRPDLIGKSESVIINSIGAGRQPDRKRRCQFRRWEIHRQHSILRYAESRPIEFILHPFQTEKRCPVRSTEKYDGWGYHGAPQITA